jgi:lysophospholipase L1-like esterase
MRITARTTAAISGLVAALALLLGAVVPGIAAASTGPYVSLGDSYTSAPLVPQITGKPILCGRSTNNYPSDVSRAIGPSSFTDVSCQGATTADMTQPQSLGNGRETNLPQFNALSAADTLVTVGVGGDDVGMIGIVEECAKLDVLFPFGSRCRNHYQSGSGDPNVAAIKATGPKVAGVIQGIHQRAPVARVMVVGYPDGLPIDGSSCWPTVPLSAGDITYINSLEAQLNQVMQQAAQANNATFVDTFLSSIGHDACKPPGTAWVNALIPSSPGFPLHPNQAGEQNMANQVLADM